MASEARLKEFWTLSSALHRSRVSWVHLDGAELGEYMVFSLGRFLENLHSSENTGNLFCPFGGGPLGSGDPGLCFDLSIERYATGSQVIPDHLKAYKA